MHLRVLTGCRTFVVYEVEFDAPLEADAQDEEKYIDLQEDPVDCASG